MRTDREIAELVLYRAGEMKKEQKHTAGRIVCACSAAAVCVAAVVLLAVITPGMLYGAPPSQLPGGIATLFSESSTGSYVFVGLVSFAIGVAVTLICRHITRKRKGGS